MTSIKIEDVKQQNRQLILKLLNKQGAMSRKDIAQTLGITTPSLSQLSKELLQEGVLQEVGIFEEGKVGRKKILLDIVPDCVLIGTMALEQFITYLGISDLKGNLLWKTTLETQQNLPPEIFLQQVASLFLTGYHSLPYPITKLLGVGVSLRGIVDPQEGKSLHAYQIWQEEVPVQQILEHCLPCPVRIDNNMRAFAQSELLFGEGRNYENLFLLKWYPGIGSAMVWGGEVYRGKQFKEGEIGHMVHQPTGDTCSCGRRGCLETLISLSALEGRIRSFFSQEETPLLYAHCHGEVEHIHHVLLSYLKEEEDEISLLDPAIDLIFVEAIDHLAQVMVNTATLLNPDVVILCGEFFQSELIYRYFIKLCQSYDPSYQEGFFLRTTLQENFFYLSGLALVANGLFFQIGGRALN